MEKYKTHQDTNNDDVIISAKLFTDQFDINKDKVIKKSIKVIVKKHSKHSRYNFYSSNFKFNTKFTFRLILTKGNK